MVKILLNEPTLLAITPAWSEGARNRYAGLSSIADLAEFAIEHAIILDSLSSFVVLEGRNRGYSRRTMQSLLSGILAFHPLSAAKEAVSLLHQVATDYDDAVTDQNRMGMNDNVSELFTASISGAITLRLLVRAGRSSDDIMEDAHMSSGDTSKPSGKNIDLIWSLRDQRAAEAYECKNDPRRLLGKWYTRNAPGNKPAWEKEQLCLMLQFHGLRPLGFIPVEGPGSIRTCTHTHPTSDTS